MKIKLLIESRKFDVLIAYGCVIFFTIIIFGFAYPNLITNVDIPIQYDGDMIFSAQVTKGMIENGWYLSNPSVGAPFSQEMFSYPNSDGLSFLILKFVGLLTGSWAISINMYYFLGFILTSISALYVFRKFSIKTMLAIPLSILYSYLPYHQIRGGAHIFLAFYPILPLLVLVAIGIMQGTVARDSTESTKTLLFTGKWEWIAPILIFAAASSTGIYYAFFAGVLLLFAFFTRIISLKKIGSIKLLIVLFAVLSVGVLFNVLPSIIHMLGSESVDMTGRSYAESEIYGLKLVQMLLPKSGHNFSLFASIKDKYNSVAPLVNENDTASLGIVGSIGFLLSLISVLLSRTIRESKVKAAGLINLFLFLLATIGGLGSVIALAGFTWIRAYNRVSVLIGFISILSFGLIASYLLDTIKKPKIRGFVSITCSVMILFFGIYDQVTFNLNETAVMRTYTMDHEYFTTVQSLLGEGDMILQLPYVPFPENPPVHHMLDYDHFKPYLHTRGIKWSYGVMKGSEEDLYIRTLSSKPIDDLITASIELGYKGILIDTYGYVDAGADLIVKLTDYIGYNPLLSGNLRYAFFDLSRFSENEARDVAYEPLTPALSFKKLLCSVMPGEWINSHDDLIFRNGWSSHEAEGRWSEGKEASISMRLSEESEYNYGSPYLEIDIYMVIGTQNIVVSMNGIDVDVFQVEEPGMYQIKIPTSIDLESGLNVEIKLPDGRQPGNGDSRILGIFVRKIRFIYL
ncbi:MAG: hypothetical protein HQ557_00770 [Bacteroidetes bacterium]|nr:hypothetical protein [Bacteroidota bacterium]